MKDNLQELTEIFDMELKNIKVSEELKFKTLEKCKRSNRGLMNKTFSPITCTIAACLFMGVIVYPIYNKGNLMNKKQITMDTREKDINKTDKPYMNEPLITEEVNITEDSNNIAINNKIVEEGQKQVNKSTEEENLEKEMLVLNEKSIAPLNIQSSKESRNNDNVTIDDGKDSILATKEEVFGKEKSLAGDASSIVIPKEKEDNLNLSENTGMKVLSLQEAREIFGDNIKIPSYVPKDFVMQSILVPEVESSSYELYEMNYANNSQYFKITGYKNISKSVALAPSTSLQSKEAEENNTIININKVPVTYTISENIDEKELPYIKLTWEYYGKQYVAEGNLPWAELINIVSSIIR